jgi:hypothetical protein
MWYWKLTHDLTHKIRLLYSLKLLSHTKNEIYERIERITNGVGIIGYIMFVYQICVL